MPARFFNDLLGFVRAACTHASQSGRELPALPFYVREHVVGWLRPSFADQLRRWPHVFEVASSFVTLRAQPDTPQGRTDANCDVTDHFIALTEEQWRDSSLAPILSDMGGTLHDAIRAPNVARTFEATPEQLLERLRRA